MSVGYGNHPASELTSIRRTNQYHLSPVLLVRLSCPFAHGQNPRQARPRSEGRQRRWLKRPGADASPCRSTKRSEGMLQWGAPVAVATEVQEALCARVHTVVAIDVCHLQTQPQRLPLVLAKPDLPEATTANQPARATRQSDGNGSPSLCVGQSPRFAAPLEESDSTGRTWDIVLMISMRAAPVSHRPRMRRQTAVSHARHDQLRIRGPGSQRKCSVAFLSAAGPVRRRDTRKIAIERRGYLRAYSNAPGNVGRWRRQWHARRSPHMNRPLSSAPWRPDASAKGAFAVVGDPHDIRDINGLARRCKT